VREAGIDAASRVAVVADIGRTTVRLGLTDNKGKLRPETVKGYDPTTQSTLSSAISAFGRECGLQRLPRRCAIAVSGVPRGDTISITNSRWILSRSGLASMLQAEPLIINDFAANAWAISAEGRHGRLESMAGATVRPYQPGAYCIIGIGSGLGVALLSRDDHGIVSVIPTEGGHTHFLAGLAEARDIAEIVGGRKGFVTAEMLLSGPGLISIYNAVAQLRGSRVTATDLGMLLSPGASRSDPIASEALDFFAKAFWHFAGNMVLAYGAWDGLILTGSVAAALKLLLRRPDLTDRFAIEGPFSRKLREVPRSMVSFKYAELEGAAVALLMEDARRAVSSSGLTIAA